MELRDAANRDLLIGLLALQNGLIDQDELITVFRTWTRDRSSTIADLLVTRGGLDASQRELLDALVTHHLKRHGDSPEKSLAALNIGRSTEQSLLAIGDPAIDATLTHVGSDSQSSAEYDHDRTRKFSVGTATSDGQRFRVLRPHARAGWGRSSWPSTAS